jgi:hypothetical protein
MKTIQPVSEQIQNSSKNPYKILFFVTLVILLAFVFTLIFLVKNRVIENNRDIKNNNQTSTLTTNSDTESNSENILAISDLQINLPKDWKIYYTLPNKAKILTETNPYNVYLTVNVNKSGTNPHSKNIPNNTPYGWVSTFDCGGPMACIDDMINNNYYQFDWNIESDQPVPKDIGGVWVPDHKTQQEDLINIIKTAKPNPHIPWNVFSGFWSFEYPKKWYLVNTEQSYDETETKIFDETQSNVINITAVKKNEKAISEEGEFNRVASNYLQEINLKDTNCSFFESYKFCASKDLGGSINRYIVDFNNNRTYTIFTINNSKITPEIEMILSSFRSSY